jgi:hypothetical protein
MAKDKARQLVLPLEEWQQIETYYGARIDDMTAEEAQAALRHCIREMHVREQEEDELWRKWQNLGFPKRPYQRTPAAPSDAGNPRVGLYKIAEP